MGGLAKTIGEGLLASQRRQSRDQIADFEIGP
jgi:hypothetical protein